MNPDVYTGLFWIVLIIIVVWFVTRIKGKSKSQIEQRGNSIDKLMKNSGDLVSSNLTKAKKFTQKKISKSYLTGCSWLLVNNEEQNILYTFRTNDELLITINGIVQKGTYELIIDNNSILISKNEITEHYNIVNIEDDFLFINMVSSNEILMFGNQTKFKDLLKHEINTLAQERMV